MRQVEHAESGRASARHSKLRRRYMCVLHRPRFPARAHQTPGRFFRKPVVLNLQQRGAAEGHSNAPR